MNQQNSEQQVFLSKSVFEIKVGNYSPGLFYKFCSNCFSTSNKKFGLGPMIIWNSSRIFSIHLLYFRNRRLNLSTKFLGWFGSDWEHWDKLTILKFEPSLSIFVKWAKILIETFIQRLCETYWSVHIWLTIPINNYWLYFKVKDILTKFCYTRHKAVELHRIAINQLNLKVY